MNVKKSRRGNYLSFNTTEYQINLLAFDCYIRCPFENCFNQLRNDKHDYYRQHNSINSLLLMWWSYLTISLRCWLTVLFLKIYKYRTSVHSFCDFVWIVMQFLFNVTVLCEAPIAVINCIIVLWLIQWFPLQFWLTVHNLAKKTTTTKTG